MTKAEKRFQELKPKYEAAYLAANGFAVHEIFFKDGWAWIKTGVFGLPADKHRLKELEEMIANLERRAYGGNNWQLTINL